MPSGIEIYMSCCESRGNTGAYPIGSLDRCGHSSEYLCVSRIEIPKGNLMRLLGCCERGKNRERVTRSRACAVSLGGNLSLRGHDRDWLIQCVALRLCAHLNQMKGHIC